MKKLLFLLLLWILILQCSTRQNSNDLVGKPAPLFTLNDTHNKTHSNTDFKGNLVLLHFWADWCASCRAEFPKLQQSFRQLQSQDFIVVAINSGQSRGHVIEFEQVFKITFPMLVDEQAVTAEKYGVRGLPMNYFLDRQGIIRQAILGWVDEQMIKNTLKDLKEGRL